MPGARDKGTGGGGCSEGSKESRIRGGCCRKEKKAEQCYRQHRYCHSAVGVAVFAGLCCTCAVSPLTNVPLCPCTKVNDFICIISCLYDR